MSYSSHHIMRCTLSPQDVEWMKAHCLASGLSSDECVEHACVAFLNVWDEELSQVPERLFSMYASPRKGMKIKAHVGEATSKALMGLASAYDYAVSDLLFTALQRYKNEHSCVREVSIHLPRALHRELLIRNQPLDVEHALSWFTQRSTASVEPGASQEMVCVELSAYVTLPTYRTARMQGELDDVCAQALASYYRHKPLMSLDVLDDSHAICGVYIDSRAYQLMRQVMMHHKWTSIKDFATHAASWWITSDQHVSHCMASADRPTSKASGWRKINVLIPSKIHEVVMQFSRLDHHVLSTTYHHILMRYLAHQIRTQDELSWLDELWRVPAPQA